MEIREISIDNLVEYENNPRKNDDAVDAVAKSIEEFGFKVPIIVDAENVIIAGHTRLKAAKKLGLEAVPCVVADDLTEEEANAFRIADNKVSEASEWDFKKLDEELSKIVELDMSEFGFTNIEYDWGEVADITEETYDEPKHDMLRCPKCGHVDRKEHFMKVTT